MPRPRPSRDPDGFKHPRTASTIYQVIAVVVGVFGSMGAVSVMADGGTWPGLILLVFALTSALTIGTTTIVLRWMAAMYDLMSLQSRPEGSPAAPVEASRPWPGRAGNEPSRPGNAVL